MQVFLPRLLGTNYLGRSIRLLSKHTSFGNAVYLGSQGCIPTGTQSLPRKKSMSCILQLGFLGVLRKEQASTHPCSRLHGGKTVCWASAMQLQLMGVAEILN